MRLSVILSTYNAPAWLEKVLWGYSCQTHRDFEIVVADDGSRPDTAALIARLECETALTIRHVWHEDRGFRKCEIMNRAIEQSAAPYLVFSDGDCIPRRDFLETHARLAERGRFLSGGLMRLPMDLSRRITVDDIVSQRATTPAWLIRQGLLPNRKWLRMAAPALVAAMLDAVTTTKRTWNGHNASGWKEDLLGVNGFDERLGYGGEDCEMGERLVNAGVQPHQIRHRAICVHLDHARGYVDQSILRSNQLHREMVRREGISWTDYGIQKTAEQQIEPTILEFPAVGEQQRRRPA